MLPAAVDHPATGAGQALFLSGALVDDELLEPESEELLDVPDLSLFDDVEPVDVLEELPLLDELASPDELDEPSPELELDESSLDALLEEPDGPLLLVA